MTVLAPDQFLTRLRAATGKVRELAARHPPFAQAVASVLEQFAAAGGAGRAVWKFDGKDNLSSVADPDNFVRGVQQNPDSFPSYADHLREVVRSGQPLLVSAGPVNHTGSPAGAALLIAPVPGDDGCRGAVQFCLPGGLPAEIIDAGRQLAEAAGKSIASAAEEVPGAPAATAPSPAFSAKLEQFLYLLQQSSELEDVAATAASDGCILLGCDRLSIAVRRGAKVSIQAVSGQKSVNPRSDATQALAALAEKVVETGEPVVYSGDSTRFPPTVMELLASFVRESGARELLVVPLYPAERPSDPKDAEIVRRSPRRRPLGCLIVEQFGQANDQPDLRDRIRVVCDHVGARLGHALEQRGILFLSLWRSIGRLREWFVGRRLALAGAIAASALVLLLALAVVPWEYRVEGDGRLMPVNQKRVFAPWDGEIVEVRVEDGDKVAKGDVLLRLRNDELHSQTMTLRRQWGEKLQLAASLQARAAEAVRTAGKDELTRLQGELERTLVEVGGLAQEVKILQERESQLTVRAPSDGVVATFQLEQLLLRRPVKRGEILMEVMDESGPWHLELKVPERRMGHVMRATAERGAERLPVRFVTATAPESTFDGTVESISTRATTADDKDRVVELIVAIDEKAVPNRRVGAEVKGRINCGQRSLGYVLFGDVVEFVRRHVWW